MKAGIYLGPPTGLNGFGRTVFWLGLLVTLAHGGFFLHQQRELVAARRRLESSGKISQRAPRAWSERERALLARLRLILDSGAISAITPTDVLRLLEDTLPDQVALEGISFDASAAGASLTLEAVAERAEDVTLLQESMASSKLVSRTEVLAERQEAGGTLDVRLQVDLEGGRRP